MTPAKSERGGNSETEKKQRKERQLVYIVLMRASATPASTQRLQRSDDDTGSCAEGTRSRMDPRDSKVGRSWQPGCCSTAQQQRRGGLLTAGFQASAMMSKQICPWSVMLGCSTLVLKLILGGLKGYSAGNLTSNLNLPPSYGVPSGPVVNVARWFVQVLVLWPALNCVCECVVVQL